MSPRLIEALFNRRMLACALLGFSSGLPFFVLAQLLPIWLKEFEVTTATVTLFAWVRAPYSWKFLWAPIVDRYHLWWLTRRRDWALFSQLALVVAMGSLAWFDPRQSLTAIAVVAFVVAAFSATQDIAIDAYRREILSDDELGFGNSLAVNAYRLASIVAGSVAVIVGDQVSWFWGHWTSTAFMLVGVVATLTAPRVETTEELPRELRSAIIEPLREFFSRGGFSSAALMLSFLFLYKLGDNLATTVAKPFYLDVGFTPTEIGVIEKLINLSSTVGGSLVGGLIILRIGINRALWIFGVVQMVSILGFAALAVIGHDLVALGAVVFFEYLGVGLGTVAFVAYIARATNKSFTATQYALFSSFIALPGIALGSMTGKAAELLGYRDFFLVCTLLALPGLLLLPKVAPWRERAVGARGSSPPSDPR